jgi:polyisoprenoid-binding protein YceI
MTTTPATTTDLPLTPGTWTLDLAHSTVEFTVRHLAISKVRGRFHRFEGVLDVGERTETTELRASVDLSSVDTGNEDRDAHLRGPDFFDVETHPQMTFVSRSIRAVDARGYEVVGDLTLNGITRAETLAVTFHGRETFPGDGRVHAGFEATGTINRSDYGVAFNVPMGGGGFVIADRVGIELDIQLVSPEA